MIIHRDLNSTVRRSLLLLIVLLSVPSILFSQKYSLKTYTTNEGLPHNNVREILTDSTGYLWISTWDGISRYDGYEFRNYHHNPDDSTTLPYFSIARIVLDGSDNIWVLSDNAKISRLDRRTNTFISITRINGEKLPVSPNICSDENGDIWIISYKVMFRYDHRSGKFTRYTITFTDPNSSLDAAARFNITLEGEKIIWLAGQTTYKLERDERNESVKLIKIYPLSLKEVTDDKILRNLDHSTWYTIYIGKGGEKWIFSSIGLFHLNEGADNITEWTADIPLKEFTGREFFFWGSQDGGLKILRSGSNYITSIPPEKVQMLKFVSSQGKDIVWYSNTSFTANALGLTKLTFVPDYFREYRDPEFAGDIPAVFSVTTDNRKNVWLGIRGRKYLTVITPDNRIIKKYTEAGKMPGFYGPPRTILKTDKGLWIGYFYDLLLFYDYSTGTFKRYDPGKYMFRALAGRKDGKIYVGNNSVIIFDPASGSREVVADSLPGGGVFRYETGEDGVLWAGLPAGMFLRYSPEEKKAKLYRINNRIYNIEDVCPGDGDVWVASLGGGLGKYDLKNGDCTFYTTADGLSNNTVYSVLRDKKGNIWASTDNGISRLNTATGVFKNFGPAEGLNIIEFNSGASYTDEDGRFYFGGMGGAVSFFPDSIDIRKNDISKSRIIISGLAVSGKRKILDKPLNRSDTINLDKGDDNFHLTIAISDFAVSERTIYRYRLSRHDREWIVTDHFNRNINYDNLRPGRYKLELEATDRDGEWRIDKDIIIILKPFVYQTHLFKLSITAFIAFMIFGMIMLYIRQLKQKARQVQDGLRLQALRGQMNPHFIFNSLNSINYFISNNDKISANRYISDFARLIRSILSNMGSDYVPFEGEMDSVKDYLEIEHLRFGDKFDYELDFSAVDNPHLYEVFPGLIQPFVENAIWHGVRALEKRKAMIRIRIKGFEDQKMTCIIEDDGIGRKKSEEMRKDNGNHKSRGISIVKERLHIIGKLQNTNYNLEVEDLFPERENTGTRVEIDIPGRVVK